MTSAPAFKYPEWAKMPSDYDFTTKGKDFAPYEKEFNFRTDAVYEKYHLLDFFRLYYKCFFYDPRVGDYVVTEPEDLFSNIYDQGMFEGEMVPFMGFTPTGRTNSFQVGLGPMSAKKTSAWTNMAKIDYYDLCALRFDRWYKCDLVYGEMKFKQFNWDREKAEKHNQYPCFRQFYEAGYTCNDDLFDFMMELHYAKMCQGFDPADNNHDLRFPATRYDSPDLNRKTYTY